LFTRRHPVRLRLLAQTMIAFGPTAVKRLPGFSFFGKDPGQYRGLSRRARINRFANAPPEGTSPSCHCWLRV
jgi:hypothetical protein